MKQSLMTYTVSGGELTREEIDAYIQFGVDTYAIAPYHVDITVDGEYVNLTYKIPDVPFQRIRRITGYLVGDISRFNDAKRAEVRDRVPHGTSSGKK